MVCDRACHVRTTELRVRVGYNSTTSPSQDLYPYDFAVLCHPPAVTLQFLRQLPQLVRQQVAEHNGPRTAARGGFAAPQIIGALLDATIATALLQEPALFGRLALSLPRTYVPFFLVGNLGPCDAFHCHAAVRLKYSIQLVRAKHTSAEPDPDLSASRSRRWQAEFLAGLFGWPGPQHRRPRHKEPHNYRLPPHDSHSSVGLTVALTCGTAWRGSCALCTNRDRMVRQVKRVVMPIASDSTLLADRYPRGFRFHTSALRLTATS